MRVLTDAEVADTYPKAKPWYELMGKEAPNFQPAEQPHPAGIYIKVLPEVPGACAPYQQELNQMAVLHAAGELTNEEYEHAKALAAQDLKENVADTIG